MADQLEIKMHRKSTDWKDRQAGWHEWEVRFVCRKCKKNIIEHVTGLRLDAAMMYRDHLCEACKGSWTIL